MWENNNSHFNGTIFDSKMKNQIDNTSLITVKNYDNSEITMTLPETDYINIFNNDSGLLHMDSNEQSFVVLMNAINTKRKINYNNKKINNENKNSNRRKKYLGFTTNMQVNEGNLGIGNYQLQNCGHSRLSLCQNLCRLFLLF